MKLGNMIEAFIADVCAGKTNETPTAYRAKLRQLEQCLGPDCEEINQRHIDTFRQSLLNRKYKMRGKKLVKGKLSKFTIRTTLATCRHFIRWAQAHNYIPQGVELRNIKEPEADPKAIDPETVDALLETAQSYGQAWERARNTAILYILRDTGSRVGPIARLEIDSLNLDSGYAVVPDKGDRQSWLWVDPPTIMAIREWLNYRKELNPVDYLLFTCTKRTGITRQGIYRMLSTLAKRAGVQGRHNPHSFRHGFARDCLLAGADLGIVSQLMNHSSVVITHKFYARWKKRELKRFHRTYSPGRRLPPIK